MLTIHKPSLFLLTDIYLAAFSIVQKLNQQGYIAYFVGGSVRDSLLSQTPTEIDIVTNAKASTIMEIFPYHKTVGAHFGVVLVYITYHNKKFSFDVATFREDGSYTDGRHPDHITFSTPKEDAQRRDFTINGLFYDPIKQNIIDYIGGLADLNNRKITTIGDPKKRFAEDKLRMLRAIRFFAQLKQWGFILDPILLHTIKKEAQTLYLVSKERIREEILKIFKHGGNTTTIQILFKTNLSPYIFPINKPSLQSYQLLQVLWLDKKVYSHKFALQYFSIFLDQINKENELKSYLKTLLLTSEEKKVIELTLLWVLKYSKQWIYFPLAEKKRLLREKNILEILWFLKKYSEVYTPKKVSLYNQIIKFYNTHKNNLHPKLWITGDTLIQKGLIPSPLFKKILERMETEQLENNIQSKHQALQYLNQLIKQGEPY